MRATYLGLRGYSNRLAKAVSAGERNRVARAAKQGADLLTNVSAILKARGKGRSEALSKAEEKVKTEIDLLRAVQYACGHCGDPEADNVPVAAEEWKEFRCAVPGEREGCLPRAKYSKTRGLGCPGTGDEEQLCCPPAGACSLSPARRHRSGGWLLLLGVMGFASTRRRGRQPRAKPDTHRM